MKISIITTTYNSENYIQETLSSISMNIYSDDIDVEHIVVDAGSTDRTKDIVEENGFSIWYELKQSSMYEAIHFGFEKSSGDILCWLNSDDILMPNSISKWMNAYKNNHVSIVSGGAIFIDEKGKEMYPYHWPAVNSCFIESFPTLMMCQPSTSWRREVYFDIGGFNLEYQITADRDFFIRAIRNYGLHRINAELSKFRIHASNMSRTKKEKALKEDQMINQRLNAGPTSIRKFSLYLLGHLISKVRNPKMILWKLRNNKRNLLHQ